MQENMRPIEMMELEFKDRMAARDVYIKDVEAKLKEAQEVIDFYANPDSWKFHNQTLKTDIIQADAEYFSTAWIQKVGGKRAREFNDKYKNNKGSL